MIGLVFMKLRWNGCSRIPFGRNRTLHLERGINAEEDSSSLNHKVHPILVFMPIVSWNLHAMADELIHYASEEKWVQA